MSDERSEFGAGLVVCLAKFSEHLHNHAFEWASRIRWWANLSESERVVQRAEAATYPRGDAARSIALAEGGLALGTDPEEALSQAIMMWMNGASDHFYDLDRDRAPEPLIALADLTLAIGHGFHAGRNTWTWEHVERIHRLWEEACVALDEQIGTNPDWGQW